MTSPPGHPPSQHEPVGRFGHCSAVVDGKHYTYGGYFGAGRSPPPSTMEILDLVTEQWQQMPTTGEAPQGHISASCAAVRTYLYHFGGRDEHNYYNTIHCFETSKLIWRALPLANNQEAPISKCHAKMVVYGNTLVISGGAGLLPRNPNPNMYVPHSEYEHMGWTNEVNCFHVDSSELC